FPTKTVTFYDGNTVLGTAQLTQHASGLFPNSYTSFTTSALVVGSHTITAVYGGDGNYEGSTSTALMVQITPEEPPPLHVSASLIPKKVGKKKALFIHLTFGDDRAAEDIRSPFQPPAFKGIRVVVEDTNGDGVNDFVLLTARRGKKKVNRIVS